MEKIRLQKFLAGAGIASRRKCEELILQVTELGTKIIPDKDIVTYEGRIIKNNENDFVYILLNKPIRLRNNC